MSAVTKLRSASTTHVALITDDVGRGASLRSILVRRGVDVELSNLEQGTQRIDTVIGYAPTVVPSVDQARELVDLCADRARLGQPIVMLASFEPPAANRAVEHFAALGCLRSYGAILCGSVDDFIETLVLIANIGLPPGPKIAIVAPPHGLLHAAIVAERQRAERLGARIANGLDQAGDGVDVVLVDAALMGTGLPEAIGGARVVYLAGRSELLATPPDKPCLVSIRPALAAIDASAQLAHRVATGLGPASPDDVDRFEPDRERFARQLRRLGPRAGDHEAKVLLAAYGIEVTRQAVATTPSAAARVAKRAGFPVEIKPWGPDCPSERDGCPVEINLHTAADVRRAFAQVTVDAGLPAGSAVIVRATPAAGREMRFRVKNVVAVGPTVLVEVDGAMDAAPAPLSLADARQLMSPICATRSNDRPLDRDAIAEVAIRISHLVVENSDVVEEIDLGRVVASVVDGSIVVVDALALLRRRP